MTTSVTKNIDIEYLEVKSEFHYSEKSMYHLEQQIIKEDLIIEKENNEYAFAA